MRDGPTVPQKGATKAIERCVRHRRVCGWVFARVNLLYLVCTLMFRAFLLPVASLINKLSRHSWLVSRRSLPPACLLPARQGCSCCARQGPLPQICYDTCCYMHMHMCMHMYAFDVCLK